jgi:hypothetical protein
MTKWEQFEYILKCVLPSCKQRSRLSLTMESNDFKHSQYIRDNKCIWRLEITKGSELFEDIKTISDFCEIYWEYISYTIEDELILELTENREEIKPIFW